MDIFHNDEPEPLRGQGAYLSMTKNDVNASTWLEPTPNLLKISFIPLAPELARARYLFSTSIDDVNIIPLTCCHRHTIYKFTLIRIYMTVYTLSAAIHGMRYIPRPIFMPSTSAVASGKRNSSEPAFFRSRF